MLQLDARHSDLARVRELADLYVFEELEDLLVLLVGEQQADLSLEVLREQVAVAVRLVFFLAAESQLDDFLLAQAEPGVLQLAEGLLERRSGQVFELEQVDALVLFEVPG